MPEAITYEVFTDLAPAELNEIGKKVFQAWVQWALGKATLGAHHLQHPTGRYASAITLRKRGPSRVDIFVDEGHAPHAGILERGHRAIDMLAHLQPDRSYPMHRVVPISARRVARRKIPLMWAQARASGFTGYAQTPGKGKPRGATNTSGTGPAWTIPAMPAYSPAKILAELAEQAILKGRGA